MWLLECDGDLFQHKKIWLRPGRTYLFGRTKTQAKPGEQWHVISDKSVSRKHLVVSVANVKPGDGTNVFAKSNVAISDESKVGTFLDDEKFVRESRTLTKNKHTIRLGYYGQHFKISWRPFVFTFSFTEKQQTSDADYLAPYRTKLEHLDIKTVHPYLTAETTHVVTSKRNIPKALQALINGKFIVTESYIDAIVAAADSPGAAEDGSALPSPLEDDIEANWPDAMRFLPEPGKEPIPRSANMFAPNKERMTVFEGYTFVFADAHQFDQLHPVVTNGSAKAVNFPMKLGETTVQEFAQYVRTVADKKGLEALADLDKGKAVVIVRFRGKDETAQWALDFLHNLDKELGQRSIEQNEFLDTILLNDGKMLYESLRDDTQATVAPTSTARSTGAVEISNTPHVPATQVARPSSAAERPSETLQSSVPAEKEEPPPTPAKHRIRRTIARSRFTGFDDFDASQLPKPSKKRAGSPIGEDDDEREPSTGAVRNGANAMDVDSPPGVVSDSQPASATRNSAANTRKRHPPPDDEDDIDSVTAMTDALLPATTAMKRRRLEDERAGIIQPSNNATPDSDVRRTRNASSAKKREPKEIDVRAAARSRAEMLDAERRRNGLGAFDAEDADGKKYGDEDLSTLRDLAIVEEMDTGLSIDADGHLTRSAAVVDSGGGGGGGMERDRERWDPRWNGRKNFKKFRRRNAGDQGGNGEDVARHRMQRVIVALEEAPRKDFGLGDSYWLSMSTSASTGRDARRDRAAGREEPSQAQVTSQSQTIPEVIDVDDDDGGVEGAERSQGLFVSQEQDPDEGPRTRTRTRTGQRQKESDSAETPTQTQKGKGKRPASSSGDTTTQRSGATAATKKQKTTPAATRQTTLRARQDDSDDDDRLRFRRKR